MSQPTTQPEDLEEGNSRGISPTFDLLSSSFQPLHMVDDRLDPQSTPGQPSQGESNIGDGSGKLFSMYSKAAEEEDNKLAESWQKDADGILIFAGLFSASVAAFLSVSVQDLRPNSQDTSAFYLGNIYEVLADPNITRASILSPLAKPPPFSPPRYSIWCQLCSTGNVNATVGTSIYQGHSACTCSPDKRARMRAFFSSGVDDLNARIIVELLPALLHISLFLFLGGLGIFLCNTNHTVFCSVIWLIAYFSAVYGVLTLLPIFLLDSPYFTPLSDPMFRVSYLVSAITTALALAVSVFTEMVSLEKREHYVRWLDQCIRRVVGGVEKGAEEIVSERSWEVDIRILGWSIRALGDDDALEEFFRAVSGFFNSKVVKHLEGDFPGYLLNMFWNALNGFLCRTSSSNLVAESVKSHRLDIGMNAMSVISSSRAASASSFPCDIQIKGWDKMPQIAEMGPGQYLTYCSSDNDSIAHYAQCIVAKILASVPERDDRWIQFATTAFGLSERDLRDYIAHGNDSLSLAISIHLIRQSLRFRFYDWDALKAFSEFDIRSTLPGLQHDFCVLWNEAVRQARRGRFHSPPVRILRWSRRHYIALHQDTDAAPTEFSSSTDPLDPILRNPLSYPSCNITSHRPHSTAHVPARESPTIPIPSQPGDSPDGSPHRPTPGGSIVPRQAEGVNTIAGPPSPSDPTTSNEIRETAEALTANALAFPINPDPRLTFASPPAAGVHDDSRYQDQNVPMEAFRHQTQSLRLSPSPLDIAMNSPKREGH
ncbi:hypothetical protein DFH94DRAFT_805739 [Russula ochroleuca]|uniref:DUF6535 domain-containing protein n=1 Tax=Russula ochroleuca TaxID=152965 RepID=A0A9P5JTN1_9AGAM|nr:hypothetical protein DFH94DRAFT_805739 [Russula ochroleuca]